MRETLITYPTITFDPYLNNCSESVRATLETAVFNWENNPHGFFFIQDVKNVESSVEDKFSLERANYEQHKAQYLEKYEGKYIALIRGEVIDSDESISKLAKRVYAKVGYQAIFMPLVTKNEKNTFRIASSKLKK